MFFRKMNYRDGLMLVRHAKAGSKNLLVLTPGTKSDSPLTEYGERLLSNVFEKTLPILGPWRKSEVMKAEGSVTQLAEERQADHVMLIGNQLSSVLRKPSGLKPHVKLMGIPVRHDGRRWISTSDLHVYSWGESTSWYNASLLGHLYRHLELLRVGLIGWDNPREPFKYRLVQNEDDWSELRQLLETKRVVAIDTETRNLERIHNTVLTIQFGFDGITGWVLPVRHPQTPLSAKLLRTILVWLKDYFERAPTAVHVYANAVFDLHQLTSLCKLRWYNHKLYDVQSAAFNLDENIQARAKFGMCFHPETLVETEVGPIKIEELCSMVNPPRVWSYDTRRNIAECKPIIDRGMHKNSKPMVEIDYEGGVLRVTADHKIWSVTREAYVEAGELMSDEEILALELPQIGASI